MSDTKTRKPIAVVAMDVAPRARQSNYPEPFSTRVAGRQKRALGDFFGLTNYGVNLTKMMPGAESSVLHSHTKQDEFIFIVEGEPTLVTDTEEIAMKPGMCAGFPAAGIAHQLVNRTDREVVYIEIGDRMPGDTAVYPQDDLKLTPGPNGTWRFTHKDGQPY
jgi:uncharacterized cupin superfamily protein